MRRTRTVAAVAALVLGAAGCGGAAGGGIGGVAGSGDLLPRCDALPELTAPDGDYRDTPVYVGNEQPIDAALAAVAGVDGFEELWIDREHNGWLTLAFSANADEARDALAAALPDAGVVVVEVDWSLAALQQLQEQVFDRAGDLDVQGTYVSVTQGVVAVDVAFLTEEVHAGLSEAFAGEPVCVAGGDPADAPADGPQLEEGEGWRLLLAEKGASEPYRTGIATSEEQLTALLTEAGFGGRGDGVEVDFASEVVVWWGVAYGSTCDDYRFDGVVVEGDALAPVVTDLSGGGACTADLLGGWGYVVAVERAALPAGPFTVVYRLGDTPGSLGEAATVVDADLTVPGAVADGTRYEPTRADGAARDGDTIETGFPWDYALYVHCGVGQLGTLNDVYWIAADGIALPTPAAWAEVAEHDVVVVEVLLEEGDPPTLTATANGHSVAYVPGSPGDGCD